LRSKLRRRHQLRFFDDFIGGILDKPGCQRCRQAANISGHQRHVGPATASERWIMNSRNYPLGWFCPRSCSPISVLRGMAPRRAVRPQGTSQRKQNPHGVRPAKLCNDRRRPEAWRLCRQIYKPRGMPDEAALTGGACSVTAAYPYAATTNGACRPRVPSPLRPSVPATQRLIANTAWWDRESPKNRDLYPRPDPMRKIGFMPAAYKGGRSAWACRQPPLPRFR